MTASGIDAAKAVLNVRTHDILTQSGNGPQWMNMMKRYRLFLFFLIIALTACTQAPPTNPSLVDSPFATTTSAPKIRIETITPPANLPTSTPREWVYYSSLSPDRTKLAVCLTTDTLHKNSRLLVYSVTAQGVPSEQLWGTFSRQTITDLEFSPDGNLLIVVLDGYFIVWVDANTGQTLQVFRGNQSNPNLALVPDIFRLSISMASNTHLMFSPDGKWLTTWNRNKSVLIWDLKAGERVGNFTGISDGFIWNTVYSSDGKYLTGRYSDRIYVWDVQTQDVAYVIPAGYGNLPTPALTAGWLAISPNHSSIAFGEDTMSQVVIWDLAQGRISSSISITAPAENSWFPPNLVFSSDGTLLAIPLAGEIAVHQLSDGQKRFAIPVSGSYPDYDFAFLPEGIVSLHDSVASTISTWDIATGTQLWTASLPIDGSLTTDTFESIPAFGLFGDAERFALTLPPTDIASLRMIDTKIGWGIASNGWVIRTTDGGSKWKKVSPIDWNFHIEDYFALDGEHAWVIQYAAQPVLWHTMDGGNTWESTALMGLEGSRGYTIHFEFRDAQQGWYLWAEQGRHGDSTPHLENTTDGGKTWADVIKFEPLGFTSYTGLLFIDERTGFLSSVLGISPEGLIDVPLVGDYVSGKALPEIKKTSDGGTTWKSVQLPQLYPIPAELQVLSAFNQQMTCGVQDIRLAHPFSTRIIATVHCVVDRGAGFDFSYFSSDGGERWLIWQPAENDFAVNDYVDSTTGWRQVSDGNWFFIQRTNDGGQTWNTLAAMHWQAVQLDFVNDEIAWALAGNDDQYMLWFTLDGGKTWQQLQPVLYP